MSAVDKKQEYKASWEFHRRLEDLRARFRAEAPWLLGDPGKIRRAIFRLLDEERQ